MSSLNRDPSRPWRSLDELLDAETFRRFAQAEFPGAVDPELDDEGRRTFLKIMGASLALTGIGLEGCVKQPEEKIVPFVQGPENNVLGRPKMYATTLARAGFGVGVLVESHQGRPTKIEGNEAHPSSLGATDAVLQAEVLSLYDPDRSQSVRQRGRLDTWQAFLAHVQPEIETLLEAGGDGVRFLTPEITSPTLGAQLREILARRPGVRWHIHQAIDRDEVREGARLAFGEELHAVSHLEQADVVVAFEADPLASGPGAVRQAREFMSRRRRLDAQGKPDPNRLYVIESSPSLSGAFADHRRRARADEIFDLVRRFAAALAIPGVSASAPEDPWSRAALDDLRKAPGRSLVLAGDEQPAAVHALVHAINARLENLGRTVTLHAPIDETPTDGRRGLRELAVDMAGGKVKLLVILGGNPAYDAPGDIDFRGALERVPLRVHLGLYYDETARLCHWHLPQSHALESWSDARSAEGAWSVVQPLIAPLYPTRSAHEVVTIFADKPGMTGHALVRAAWAARWGLEGAAFESRWRRVLHDGVDQQTAVSTVTHALSRSGLARAAQDPTLSTTDGLEITFRADPHVDDGRHANNAWLQELPKPITRLTWDNAALVSPATATRLRVENGDVLELEVEGVRLRIPAWITPGQADESIRVHLGYGRAHAGNVGGGLGFDVFPLRRHASRWRARGAASKTHHTYELCSTQDHGSMEGRALVRRASVGHFAQDPGFARAPDAAVKPLSMYPKHPQEGPQWGMVIDLGSCTGCNACTIACQSENNIATVGKRDVAVGREMHWIRVDRYFEGEVDDPVLSHQPVPCMHCENAPCEYVCPVNATVHGPEGLNEMVYNRCVGTRYCSNNCPYKVRRFNFRLYSDYETPSLKPLRNPDVTVRSRGVMEKCTYCVQRINEARIEAKKAGRPIPDGGVVTACQSACPTQAITFGDVSDPTTAVSRLKASPLNYTLLAEVNAVPRTSYLAKLENPHPSLALAEPKKG